MGAFSSAPLGFSFDITDPIVATVYVDAVFSEVTPSSVSGTVIKEGETTASASFGLLVNVDLHIEVGRPAGLSADCLAGPVAIRLATRAPFATNVGPVTVTLADDDFRVPTVPITTECPEIIANGVNGRLQGGGHAIEMEVTGTLPGPTIGAEASETSLVAPAQVRGGDDVVLVATVAAAAGAAPAVPSGQVEFRDGVSVLGSSALDPDGRAAFTTSSLAVGRHQVTARYLGDETYGRSESAVASVLVIASPTIEIGMTSSLLIAGPPRAANVTIDNPSEFGVDITGARLDLRLARPSHVSAPLDPTRIAVEWNNGGVWEPVPLTFEGPSQVVVGSVIPTDGFSVSAGRTLTIPLRIAAPDVGSGDSCNSTQKTCPGLVTFSVDLVQAIAGADEVFLAEDDHDFTLVESTRRPSTIRLRGNAPRPHTVRQGYSLELGVNMAEFLGGTRPGGSIEVLIDGQPNPTRGISTPLEEGFLDRLSFSDGGTTAIVLLPPDIDPGTHVVTVRYSGDRIFAPSELTTPFYVNEAVGVPFVCLEGGFLAKTVWGANLVFDAAVPASAAPGTVSFDFANAYLTMNRSMSTDPWVPLPNNANVPIGEETLTGISFRFGTNGTGSATALQRQGGTPQPPIPQPAAPANVDQTVTFHGATGTVTVDGQPGSVVPVELDQIVVDYALSEREPLPLKAVCEPVDDALHLGEVEVEGTILSVDPSAGVVEGDEVTLTAESYPAGAAGTMAFSSTLDGDLGTVPVTDGVATLVTDALSDGVHVLMAVFTPTGDGGPSESNAVTILVVPRPASATEAFVTAALVDFTGTVLANDVTAGARAIDGGQTRPAYLTDLSRSDEWLTGVVNELYMNALGRDGEPDGVAFWVNRLRNGWTVARVAASFYASDEYYNATGGTPESWIDDLYETLLGREAEEMGRDYWIGEIPDLGRGVVALRFFQSRESADFRVTNLYGFLLDRKPSGTDRDFWSPYVLARGDLVLAVSLAASPEYFARAGRRFPPG